MLVGRIYVAPVNIAALVAIAAKSGAGDFANRFPNPMLVVRKRTADTTHLAHATDLDWKQGTRAGGFNTQRNGPGERRSATPSSAIGEASVEPVAKSTRNPFDGMITIGRAPNNDIILHLSSVSKLHGYFRREGTKWLLQDKGSSNGTIVNGARLKPEEACALDDGAHVLFGPDADCLFKLPLSLHAFLVQLAKLK